MVEVASSNLAGPTKFLSLCFSRNLFFVFAESTRVVASYLYLRKVETETNPPEKVSITCPHRPIAYSRLLQLAALQMYLMRL